VHEAGRRMKRFQDRLAFTRHRRGGREAWFTRRSTYCTFLGLHHRVRSPRKSADLTLHPVHDCHSVDPRGRLTAAAVPAAARVRRACGRVEVRENPTTAERAADKRFIGNAIQVFFMTVRARNHPGRRRSSSPAAPEGFGARGKFASLPPVLEKQRRRSSRCCDPIGRRDARDLIFWRTDSKALVSPEDRELAGVRQGRLGGPGGSPRVRGFRILAARPTMARGLQGGPRAIMNDHRRITAVPAMVSSLRWNDSVDAGQRIARAISPAATPSGPASATRSRIWSRVA
jgi:hypothetical protein